MISGNMVGSYSQIGKTFILVDEDGNEITGVCVDNPVVFTAGDNDVREGMVYASDDGISTGTKDIPIYRTWAGSYLIMPGKKFSIPFSKYNQHDYTVFQCMISLANMSNFDNSVETSMVSIKDGVYEVNSAVKMSDVSVNLDNKSIDLNISNNSENYYVIHYFTYREEE
jgi:hypothetical protein